MDELRREPRVLAFRILVVLMKGGRILLSQRGPASEGDIAPRVALGFEGIVRREDKSLFSQDEVGLSDAVLRSLSESLDFPAGIVRRLEEIARSLVLFEERDPPAGDDLMVIVSLNCAPVPEVVEATKGIATLEWEPLPIRANDLDRFDRWSSRIVSDPSLQSAINR